MKLLQCENLQASDIYFEELLTTSSNMTLLGDIELSDEELKHLSELISKELKKPNPDIENSLSVAVFLVWMGILHYRDNFWEPVYRALELPDAQIKWQKILGETFIQAIEKYKLPNFEGKLRYIIPILSHGYVPNYYLDNYFRDVVMALFINRKNLNPFKNLVNLDEIRHIVLNWQYEYTIYQNLQEQMTELEKREESIIIALELLKNRDNLLRLNELKNKLREFDELNELLALPDNWLDRAEAERDNLYQVCTLLEKAYEFAEIRRAKLNELCELNQKIESAAAQVLDYWDESFVDPILELPVGDIEKIAIEFFVINRMFTGYWGWILRAVLWWRYKQAAECKRKLVRYLCNLPVKGHLLEEPRSLPERLKRIRELIELRREIERQLEEINKTEQEIAASKPEMTISQHQLFLYKEQLSRLKDEIAAYKMRLIKLGKGSLEKGKEELNQQKNIRREIETIKDKISSHIEIDVLLDKLHLIGKDVDENFLSSNLIDIRKQKTELKEKTERINKPLYALNESTRTFLLQGGELSVNFIFNSLLLMQKLDQGDSTIKDVALPSRIIHNMEKWWHLHGKNMMIEAQRQWDWLETGDVALRRPIIRLNTLNGSIEAELPQQLVKEATEAVFIIRGESGIEWVKEVFIKQNKEGQFRTEPVIVELEQPESVYNFELICGEINRSWEIKGLNDDKLCLIFNSRGELIEYEQLPAGDVYLVIPAGSKIEPDVAVKEQGILGGGWAGYEYWYLSLEDVDMVLVESVTGLSILKRKIKLEPRLVGGNRATFLKSKGNTPVYIDRLPCIIFTPHNSEELSLYGVRLDYSDDTLYFPLEKLGNSICADKDVYLPLEAIAGKVIGFCKASLIFKQSVIWSEDFIIIPYTELHFDRDIYYPQMKIEEMGKLEIYSRYPFSFSVHPPGTLVDNSPRKAVIKFDTRYQHISGEICYYVKGGQNFTSEVYIEIPSIRWRKSENDVWRAEVEELWHEDIGEIQVQLPHFVSGEVTLALEDGSQVISRHVDKTVITLNLRQFSDTIRESGRAVHTMILGFKDSHLLPCPLVRVRTRWQVAGVKIEQKLEDGIRTVALVWREFGKAARRIIRFWPLNISDASMVEYCIPDGETRIENVESREKLPAGRYRLQFAVDDPWSENEIVMPCSAGENCFDVTIGSRDERLQDVFDNGLIIEGFECEGKKISSGREYRIRDIHIVPEFEGEERFQGIVYTIDEEANPVDLKYNPVSFYFESEDFNRLPFLLDRDKDGAMYCIRCRTLFWENAHKECKGQVIFPDYIHVMIRREKDGFRSFKGN